MEEYVVCQICNKKFKSITNTHLNLHKITCAEYITLYPNEQLKTEAVKYANGSFNRNKTYEEMYGPIRATELKNKRKESAIQQFQDQGQRDIRCIQNKGKVLSISTKKLISTSKRKNNGTFNNYGDYRERAIEYYGTDCMKCGKILTSTTCMVHHIDHQNFPNRYGNHAIENLIILCRSCHTKEHKKFNIAGKIGSVVDKEIKKIHELIGVYEKRGIIIDFESFKEYIDKFIKKK